MFRKYLPPTRKNVVTNVVQFFWIALFLTTVYLAAKLIMSKVPPLRRMLRAEFFQKTSSPVIERLKDKVRQVLPIDGRVTIQEGDKSYSLDKEEIYLCVRDKKSGKIYDDNMLVYVLLHELAHCVNREDVGHTQAFHKTFNELLERAIQVGIYNPNIPHVKDYCE